ncbi:MAG: UMP kinase [Alphaproteobacteria bacterium]|nr:UMP kinase [Alphaproteobacteria bacterium]
MNKTSKKPTKKSPAKSVGKPAYRRVMLKISGEALMGDGQYGQDSKTIEKICRDIKASVAMGVELCLVVGGGNIFRGIEGANSGMERASADYMGMLATVLNALAIQNTLERMGLDTRVLSAINMMQICEPYVRRRAVRHLERGRVVIFAAGTGNPYFTTDTAAALRANEMGCGVLMKGTQVDGVYSADPKKDKKAKHFARLTYHEVLVKDLKVMDASAISLARENQIPVLVFSLKEQNSIASAICGKGKFTLITDKK